MATHKHLKFERFLSRGHGTQRKTLDQLEKRSKCGLTTTLKIENLKLQINSAFVLGVPDAQA
jgi:hypothetical protein